MNRRNFVLGCTGAVALLAGCTEDSGPSLSVLNPDTVEAQIIDSRQGPEDGQFSIELENSGMSGNILVKLYWTEDGETRPNPVADRTVFFNRGERREMTFNAEIPSGADGYEFSVQGLGYGADIENSGERGDADVRLIDVNTDQIIQTQPIRIDSGETKTVTFETDHVFETEFEIEAEVIEN